MIEVPSREYKFLVSKKESVRMQILMKLMLNTLHDVKKKPVLHEEVSILCELAIADGPLQINTVCDLIIQEFYPEIRDKDLTIRTQILRNKIGFLTGEGYITKSNDPGNKRVKLIQLDRTKLNVVVPDGEMIVYKYFTPAVNASAQA